MRNLIPFFNHEIKALESQLQIEEPGQKLRLFKENLLDSVQ